MIGQRRGKAHVGYTRRSQHQFPDRLRIVQPAGCLDHAAKHGVAQVGIDASRAGWVVGRLRQRPGDNGLDRRRRRHAQSLRHAPRVQHGVGATPVIKAAAVGEQLSGAQDSEIRMRTESVGQPRRQHVDHRRIQVQSSLLGQAQNCDRRDRLGHAGDAHARMRRERWATICVGQTEGAKMHDLAATEYSERSSRQARARDLGCHAPVERNDRISVGRIMRQARTRADKKHEQQSQPTWENAFSHPFQGSPIVPPTLPLSEPVLLLDEIRVRRNIQRMADRARQAGVRLRPHFKTHQSHEVGRWFRDFGVETITVSSLAMAEYFADDGWTDITLAFPFHPGMLQRIDALAARLRIGITLADAGALEGVRFHAPVDAWIKIDVGSHRTGFDAADLGALCGLAADWVERDDLRLRGLLAHAGHSYAARGIEDIGSVHSESLHLLNKLREDLSVTIGHIEISVGDTPTCSRASTFPGVDEIRPGNFVFYDLSQWQIGACAIDDIAVAMACPIAARHPERGQLVVHGGAVHFSKDWLTIDGRRIFGLAVEADASGWGRLRPDIRLVALSQEHGIVEAPRDFIEQAQPGETLYFLPVHSCLTADTMGCYRSLDGRALSTMRRS
jgi:D-serine deaminase-like pyridoxal phosphate-dependent protein